MSLTVFGVSLLVAALATPAVAGQGWYLLAPPLEREGKRFMIEAPLSRYRQLGAFDSAAECEKVRVTSAPRSLKQSTPAEKALAEDLDTFTRCIATNDPRLQEPRGWFTR